MGRKKLYIIVESVVVQLSIYFYIFIFKNMVLKPFTWFKSTMFHICT